jgi:hypothetical protein
MLQNGLLKLQNNELIPMAMKDHQPLQSLTNAASDFFETPRTAGKAVAILDPYLDFGSNPAHKAHQSKTIRVANYTKGKVTCLWVHPEEKQRCVLKFQTSVIQDI